MTILGEALFASNSEKRPLSIGEVTEISSQQAENTNGYTYTDRCVFVQDITDMSEISTSLREKMNDEIDVLDQALLQHPEWQPPKKGKGYQDGTQADIDSEQSLSGIDNPAWEWFYQNDLRKTSMLEWRELIPSAKALYPMQRLNDATRVFKSGYVDSWAMNVFTNSLDCIGLRSRAAIAREITLEAANRNQNNTLQAVSLGCGAAVPNIDTTIALRDSGKRLVWDLYDIDGDSLSFARDLSHDAEIPAEDFKTHEASFLRAFALPKESIDVVDVLGLWEYLDHDQCVKLLRKSYDLLRPGGVFMASNMLSSRKQLAFNQRGVGWWPLKHRMPDELIDIVAKAGIDTDATRVTIPQDGVYAVMEIHKS